MDVEAKVTNRVLVDWDFVDGNTGERIPLNMNHSWRGWLRWLRYNAKRREWAAVRHNLRHDLWKTVKATFRST